MMKKYLKRWLIAGAIILSAAGQASAVPNCASAASDPDGDGWGWENNQSCKVVPNCASAASDPDGDGWGWENNQSCKVVAQAAKGFTVAGSVLKDANGNAFIARGVNNPHAWYDTQAYDVLANLAGRKTNLIRVVWTMGGSPSRLDQILTAIEAQKMVSIVELHDGTGSNDTTVLQNMANYWARADVVAILKKHERTIMVNIANEWGDNSMGALQWRDAYMRPITTLRDAGLTTTIVIDSPKWGQDASGGLLYGWDLLNHDPRHNLLFSVHAYAMFNNPNDIYNMMNNYKSNNLPLLIGEFGYNYNNGNNNLGSKVDAPLLMQYAQQFGVGYVAWSTAGNDAGNAWLDLLTNWSGTTSWGNTVWYSQYGISNTARKASIY
ncbi:MAG TPA: cellulase family glycosylhydrolase [Duganella sp.]|nr:cellulase family glycosylhydrolase [Duganella sp.]